MKTLEALEARLVLAAPDATTGRFMFMPAGTHTCHLSRSGVPVTVTIHVNPVTAAAALNAQLAAVSRERAPQKAYCDFNHDRDKASFWPTAFEAAADGVYVIGEFSASGKAAVEGKDYRGFSPTFFTDAEIPEKPLLGKARIEIAAGRVGSAEKPAQIVCNESAGLNFGGLVNEPAFKNISPLWARDAAGAHEQSSEHNNHDETMDKEKLAALQAKNTELETQIKALTAKADATEIERAQLSAKQSEQRAIKAEITAAELQAKDQERRERDADAAVKAAVKAGKLPAQNTELQAKWKAQLTTDPASIVMLEAMTPAPLAARQTGSVQVTGTDPGDVLRAYARMPHHRERGALYAKEIAPLLAKGAGLVGLDAVRPEAGAPLDASNSFGTLVGNIISQRVLELLRFQLPSLNRITTDFSDQQVKYNQTVLTRYIGIPTVGTYNTSTGYPAISTAAASDVPVTINQHKCVELDLNAEQLSGTARRLFDEQIPAMSYALAKDLVDYVYALIVAGTFTNTAIAETAQNFGRPTIVDIAKALTDQGVPIGSQFRTLLLNTAYFAALQKDTAIVNLAVFQRPEYISENQLPPVGGFQVIEAPNLPTTGNLSGFGFSKSALVAATRLPMDYTSILPGASFGQVQQVSDPDTGAAMMQVAYVNHTLGTANFRLAWMYGAAAGQVKAGQILTSQ